RRGTPRRRRSVRCRGGSVRRSPSPSRNTRDSVRRSRRRSAAVGRGDGPRWWASPSGRRRPSPRSWRRGSPRLPPPWESRGATGRGAARPRHRTHPGRRGVCEPHPRHPSWPRCGTSVGGLSARPRGQPPGAGRVEGMSLSNLHRLRLAGVSPWSDQISRRMLDSGELARRIEEDAVTGVTSNPSIFAKAILGTEDYDEEAREMVARGAATEEIIASLMASDIQGACDALRGVYDSTDGRDGFVSVEVTPTLAHDTEGTVAEAREWVKRIDRPNLFVKVPATEAGLPAIQRLVAEGISINVTLIFSLERYRQVMQAYL